MRNWVFALLTIACFGGLGGFIWWQVNQTSQEARGEQVYGMVFFSFSNGSNVMVCLKQTRIGNRTSYTAAHDENCTDYFNKTGEALSWNPEETGCVRIPESEKYSCPWGFEQ
jgi:hypothetical protein